MTLASIFVPGSFAVRTPTTMGVSVHGGGRRPGRQAALDLDALAEFNAGTTRAVEANRVQPQRERWLEALAGTRRWVAQ